MNIFRKTFFLIFVVFTWLILSGLMQPTVQAASPATSHEQNMTYDPGGFCDLHWGEPLNQIKQEYRMKLLGYSYGMARYWVLIPDAHGEMYLQGPVMAKVCFYEGRLLSITIFMNGGFEERVRHISHRYGTPRRFEGLYVWEGPYTTMLLGQDDKGITLMMLSNVLKKIRM